MTARTSFLRRILPLVILVLLAGAAWGLWVKFSGPAKPQYRTAEARMGNLTQTVSANGTLKPVVLVNVGTQVSGSVRRIHVDFNDQVKTGQILLELDPSVLNAQVEQTEANLANVHASLDLAMANEARARTLFAQEYISRQEFDQALQAVRSARAQVAQVTAQLTRDKTNQGYTIIRSPVSGVVVSRSVDIGQTVAASFQTPTLFQIAQDLRNMQIDSAFAEADIGAIKVGQPVQFTVDAFPNRTFQASVKQIRLNATTTQNVVTYNVVVEVDNPDKVLLPGMTAYVSVIIAERSNVLLIPNAALRFRPPDAGQRTARSVPGKAPGAAAGASPPGGGETATADALTAPDAQASTESAAEPAAKGRRNARRGAGKEGGQGRSRSGGADGGGTEGGPDAGGTDGGTAGRTEGRTGGRSRGEARAGNTEVVRGAVHVLENGQLRRVPVRLGISDGRSTEVLGGALQPGATIVTGIQESGGEKGSAQGTFRIRMF